MRAVAMSVMACMLMMPAATPLLAEGAPVLMRTADAVKGWQAVGKLVLGDRGFCTGVLIDPQLVLTAAHCMFDKETGARTPEAQMRFQAGWRDGRAEAYRGVRRSVVHPDYLYSGEEELARVAHDLALVELDQPILLPQLAPFAIDDRPAEGASVSVVSYAQGRSEAPAIERDCAVLSATDPAVVLSCDIDFGSSGAPVFAMTEGGARVVSVISAKAEMDGHKVALAVPLEVPLAVLRQALAADAAAQRSAPGVRILRGGTGSGAKFLSP